MCALISRTIAGATLHNVRTFPQVYQRICRPIGSGGGGGGGLGLGFERSWLLTRAYLKGVDSQRSKTICTWRSVSTSLSEIHQRSRPDEIPLGLDHFPTAKRATAIRRRAALTTRS